MGEKHSNLWAPWRVEYIRSLADAYPKQPECFICDYLAHPEADRTNHVLQRTGRWIVLMNLYPYTTGHVLLAPYAHTPDFHDLDDDSLLDHSRLTRDWIRVLTEAVHCDGLNVGMNFGRCAGAGLPGHLHVHVVPRWAGDTNFMSVTGHTRVMPLGLDDLYDRLREAARSLSLEGIC